jgi:hypothetical protein
MPKITKRGVDAAPCPTRHADKAGVIVFFEIRSSKRQKASGGRRSPPAFKSYVLKHLIGSCTRRLKIGRHGLLWTAKGARHRARDLLCR